MEKSLLNSRYIIDGVPCELTPSQMLGNQVSAEEFEPIVDETVDPELSALRLDRSKISEYYKGVQSCKAEFPYAFAAQHTRFHIAKALLDAMWKKGQFTLEDISLEASWKWKDSGVGTLSAFYNSVSACCETLDSLYLSDSKFKFSQGACFLDIQASNWAFPVAVEDKIAKDPSSWLVYIPFFPDEFSLGGSTLAAHLGSGSSPAPLLQDLDYFMDCFEVVRELVEDNIILSGCTVAEGGLYSALRKIRYNSVADISDICKAYKESDIVKILFAEVPGALIQIAETDFDYVDAELLLQDVLYFPLGHPSKAAGSALSVRSSAATGIQSILASLIREA